MRGRAVLCWLLGVLALHTADAGPPDGYAHALDDLDLGESAAILLGVSAEAEVGAMADYKSTKKKYEGLIKKVRADLKKKKAAAKKKFDAQMKKASKVFAKLYAPIKKGPAPALGAPLGPGGQGGISSMARWAYATQVASWTKIAHKKIARYELLLQENRFRHFSTAVCKEVLKSKVDAIGDLQYKKKKADVRKAMKKQKQMLNRKVAFDRADMDHKVAAFKLWKQNSKFAVDGGVTGPAKGKTHMMTVGQTNKMGDSREGELVQAAHWAYARQKAHAIDFYDRNLNVLKKRLKKIQKQHDLTLCRTGRKPNSPQLKFELKRAKKSLKKQIKKLPAKAQQKAASKKLKKKIKKKQKKVAKAKKKKKKKKKTEIAQTEDLGESSEVKSFANDHVSLADRSIQNAAEFHKLVDASGGDETISERVHMFRNLVSDIHDGVQTQVQD